MRGAICFLVVGMGLVISSGLRAQGITKPASTQTVTDLRARAPQSMALILVGDGEGHTQSVVAGAISRSDGIVLTAYHFVKGAREVQVRLSDGEIYDQVEITGFDERRDVVALHFAALGLTPFTVAQVENCVPGDKIHALTADGTLAWRLSDGVLGQVRLADEVLGAGHGYRVIQFMVPLPAGAPSGALLNSLGQLLGIITSPQVAGGEEFAVPMESITGLSTEGLRIALGNGKDLALPPMAPGLGASSDAQPSLASAETLRIISSTSFFTPFMLEGELLNTPEFRSLGINVVSSAGNAGLVVNVDRPLFTYDFTFSICDSHSGVVLATGKVTAIDGPHAAKAIAKKLVLVIEKDRGAQGIQPSSQQTGRAQD